MLIDALATSYLGHPAMITEAACAICGETSGQRHSASERMFGFGGEFAYFECSSCGCLQLLTPPDLGRFYPDYYYSYSPPLAPRDSSWANLRCWAARRRSRAQLLGVNAFWRFAAKLRPRQDVARLQSFLAPVGRIDQHSRILDVGSGAGTLLCELADAGFEHLVGVDPYLKEDTTVGPFVRLRAASLDSVNAEFDVVMFNHSLEHMPDQESALRNAAKLLSADGVCIIATPLAGSDAWSAYGTDWVELDAPRHYFLHTQTSLDLVAKRAGLAVYRTVFDTNAFAYWGSELYRRGLTLYDSQAGALRQAETHFSTRQLSDFTRRAAAANDSGRAGRATFYLRNDR